MLSNYRLLSVFLTVFVATLIGQSVTDAQDIRSVVTATITNDQAYSSTRFSVAESGKTFVAEMRAVTGDLDPQLFVLRADDPERIPIAFNDNRNSNTTDAFIAIPNIPIGEYVLVAARYALDAGTTSGDYELSLGFSNPGDINVAYDVSDAGLQAAGYPAITPQPQAAWTILAYYGADNDLEPGVLNDFNEFELAGGSDSTVRVVAMVDRIPGFAAVGDDSQSARIYELRSDVTGDTANFPPTPDTPPLAELGEVDMGNGQTLAQFLTWGMRQYPANNYAVAFASHGAAWRGIIQDDTNGRSVLSVPELEQAFSQSLAAVGRQRFDLLINDACYMASVEYYAGIAPYFSLSIASAEYVVDPALNMTALVNSLRQNPTADIAQLSAQLVNEYINNLPLRREDLRPYLTNAVTNLGAFGAVADEVNSFSRLVNTDMNKYGPVIAQARMFSYEYSTFLGIESFIDLGGFMRAIINVSQYAELTDAANRVLGALSVAHIFGDAGSLTKNLTSYYNIYFPENSTSMSQDYFVESNLVNWGEMIRNYHALYTPQSWSGTRAAFTPDAKDVPDLSNIQLNLENVRFSDIVSTSGTRYEAKDDDAIVIPSIAFHESVTPTVSVVADADTDPLPITATITGRDIRDARLTYDVVLGNNIVRRYSDESITADGLITSVLGSGVFEVNTTWQPSVFFLSDGTSENQEFGFTTPGTDLVTIEAQYRAPELDNFQDVSMLFSATSGDLLQALSYNAENDSAASIEIPANSELQVYWQNVTPDGRVVREPGNLYTWSDSIALSTDSPSNGTYRLGIMVNTFAGVQQKASFEVTVEDGAVISVEAQPPAGAIDWSITEVGTDLAQIAYPSNWDITTEGNTFTATEGDNIVFDFQIFETLPNSDTITCEAIQEYAQDFVRPNETTVELEDVLYGNNLNWLAEQWVYDDVDIVGRTYATTYETADGTTLGMIATMSLPFEDIDQLYDVLELMIDSVEVASASLSRCTIA